MKKRVLFLLGAFDKGGIEKVTLDIVNSLEPEKYDITIYTLWYGGNCQSKVNKNIEVRPFFFKKYVRGIIRLVNILSPKMLYRLFIRGTYDIEIAAGDGACSKIIAGSPNKKSRKIAWIHMDVIKRGSRMKEFANRDTARAIYEKFDKILCVSKASLDSFEEKFGKFDNIAVAYNPMPKDEIIEMSGEKVEDVAFEKDCFNFITVGRLVEQKGFDRLIRVVNSLKKEIPEEKFKVYVVGEGPEREKLEGMIREYDLSETIILLGYKDNPYKYIKEADAYVMSSRDEAFPLCIGEAIILHKVVVATECNGIDEWFCGNKYGLMVENNEEALLEGMKKMLVDKELYNNYSEAVVTGEKNIDFNTTLREFEGQING